MAKTMALVATGVNQVELREVKVADPTDTQVVVANRYSVASPGTELRCLAGQQEQQDFPFVMGYSAAGVVEKAGKASGLNEGDEVCCPGGGSFLDVPRKWGGHAQRLLMEGGSLLPCPAGVDLRHAAIGKVAAVPYHGYRLAGVNADRKVVVLGLGLIGQVAARLFNAACETVAADLDEARVAAARAAGVEAMTIDRDLQPLMEQWADRADVVVDGTGVSAAIDPAVNLLRSRPWGDIDDTPPVYLVQGSYPASMSIDYQPAFMKEAVFVLARDHGRADVGAVLDAIAQGTLNVDDLLSHVVSPADAQSAYDQLRGRSRLMTVVFDWSAVS